MAHFVAGAVDTHRRHVLRIRRSWLCADMRQAHKDYFWGPKQSLELKTGFSGVWGRFLPEKWSKMV